LQVKKTFRNIFKAYGFDQVESKKDFEGKLDRAITGLENEVIEKRRAVQSLMDELGMQTKTKGAGRQHAYI
jgi:hypothetical protein